MTFLTFWILFPLLGKLTLLVLHSHLKHTYSKEHIQPVSMFVLEFCFRIVFFFINTYSVSCFFI